jgi:hypothetical protein
MPSDRDLSDRNALFLIKTLSALGRADAVADWEEWYSRWRRYTRPHARGESYRAQVLVALGDYDRAVARLHSVSDPHERARAQEEVAVALADAGAFGYAERLARAIGVPTAAARALVHVAGATKDPGQARRLTEDALQTGGWVAALPALLKIAPEVVPLVVEAAQNMLESCLADGRKTTAARTSAPSST